MTFIIDWKNMIIDTIGNIPVIIYYSFSFQSIYTRRYYCHNFSYHSIIWIFYPNWFVYHFNVFQHRIQPHSIIKKNQTNKNEFHITRKWLNINIHPDCNDYNGCNDYTDMKSQMSTAIIRKPLLLKIFACCIDFCCYFFDNIWYKTRDE